MKKILGILVFGLLLSTNAYAANDKLQRCYLSNVHGIEDIEIRRHSLTGRKFNEYRVKKFGFLIDKDHGTVKWYWTWNDIYSLGFNGKGTSEGMLILKVVKDTPAKKAKLKKKRYNNRTKWYSS